MRSTHISLACLHEFRIYVPVPPYFPTTLSRPLRSRHPLASTCQSNLHKIPFRELNRISYKARMNLLCSVLFLFLSDHIRLGGVSNLLDATILATIQKLKSLQQHLHTLRDLHSIPEFICDLQYPSPQLKITPVNTLQGRCRHIGNTQRIYSRNTPL